MLEALNITEAEAQGLTDIAALDLAMAKTFAAKAQAAEDPDVAARMARSYHRCTRSYRQTLLLKSRLQRAMAEAPEPNPADAPRRPPKPRPP